MNGNDMERLAAFESIGMEPEDLKLVRNLLADICEGIGRERMAEIVEAEKDGRLIALPCKIGTKVYQVCACKRTKLNDPFVYVSNFKLTRNNALEIVLGGHLGRTVFLSRAEADAEVRRLLSERKPEKSKERIALSDLKARKESCI